MQARVRGGHAPLHAARVVNFPTPARPHVVNADGAIVGSGDKLPPGGGVGNVHSAAGRVRAREQHRPPGRHAHSGYVVAVDHKSRLQTAHVERVGVVVLVGLRQRSARGERRRTAGEAGAARTTVKLKGSIGFHASELLLIPITSFRTGVEPRVSYKQMLRSEAVLPMRHGSAGLNRTHWIVSAPQEYVCTGSELKGRGG